MRDPSVQQIFVALRKIRVENESGLDNVSFGNNER